MELSAELKQLLSAGSEYAAEHRLGYITPEVFMIAMCGYARFTEAFEECGGVVAEYEADLVSYCENYIDEGKEGEDAEVSSEMAQLILESGRQALYSGRTVIGLDHVIYGLWDLTDSYAVYYIEKQGIGRADLVYALDIDADDTGVYASATDSRRSPGSESDWTVYAPCINDMLDDVNPLIGREEELERTIQVLSRKDKNNPLHIGEPGVGKTAITYGLARLINEDSVPEPIRGSRIYALDLGGMVAGTQYRGDFEKRFKMVLSAIDEEDRPIVYIDEIHNLSGAGAVGEGSQDAANMLKPYLSGGHIRFIGATTFDEYKKHFEKNKSLVRRFQNIEIREPSQEETVRILEGLKPSYEGFHGVKYADGTLEYAVSMSVKYINERFLPDKAIDLMDEAGAYRKLHPEEGDEQIVDKDCFAKVLTNICRVPIESVETEETDNLIDLDKEMKASIFGQDEALTQVVNAIKFSRAGLLEDNKPLASLLFVGPTGVGKTEVARTLAEKLGVKLIRFDMSEYAEKHAVAKLIGSPAGYVGYEEGGLLTEAVRKNPSAVLLLDEIEKAHPDIYSILLQVMDYATLTDNQGRKADFRNTVLIMTSNAGANRLGKKSVGFESGYQDNTALMEEVKRIFQPEFRNRLNKIVMFNPMDDEMADRIIDKKMRELSGLVAKKNIVLTADDAARALIHEKGISREFGARELDRVIRNEIKTLMVDDILFGDLKDGGKITLTAVDDEFSIIRS